MLTASGQDYETTWGRFGNGDKTAKHKLRGSKNTLGKAACASRVSPHGRAGSTGVHQRRDCGRLRLASTFAALAGAKLPADRINRRARSFPLLFGQPGAKPPHDTFFYYHSFRLGAVREGKWKLMIAATGRASTSRASRPEIRPPQLFDLEDDLAETTDLAARHPEVVARLPSNLPDQARATLVTAPGK